MHKEFKRPLFEENKTVKIQTRELLQFSKLFKKDFYKKFATVKCRIK